ncbi:enhanced intracellular survival protein Eis [Halobacteriaceae archaeon GCM10025711]
MTVRRTEEWWRSRVFTGWRSDPYAYAWERDGEVRGYVVYTIEDGDDGKTFRVRDRAWTDEEAYLNVLRFVHNHEAQVDSVRWPDPVDTPLLDLVDDPRAVDVELSTGIMFRVVDVPTTLERLAYDPAVDASLVLSVADETADWNEGTYRLDVADGTGTVTRTDADVDVHLDVTALSQLVVGYLTPDRAALLDGVSEMAPGARETLAAVFPPAPVFPRDFF